MPEAIQVSFLMFTATHTVTYQTPTLYFYLPSLHQRLQFPHSTAVINERQHIKRKRLPQ